MISVRIVHVGDLDQRLEDLIVSIAVLQIHVEVLDIASSQINTSILSGD